MVNKRRSATIILTAILCCVIGLALFFAFAPFATAKVYAETEAAEVRNNVRNLDGSPVTFTDRTYGVAEPEVGALRPEHGDVAVYIITERVTLATIDIFAAKFENDKVEYFDAKRNYQSDVDRYEALLTSPKAEDGDYFVNRINGLNVGSYRLTVFIPKVYLDDTHTSHWWDPEAVVPEYEKYTTVYSPLENGEDAILFDFDVKPFDISDTYGGFADGVSYSYDGSQVAFYTGFANNTPPITVKKGEEPLARTVDYTVTSDRIDVGRADMRIEGKGNYMGTVVLRDEFEILKAYNNWVVTPNIIRWTYGNYDPEVNTLEAQAAFKSDDADIVFKIALDRDGKTPVDGLDEFTYSKDGSLEPTVTDKLAKLAVGKYYMFATLADSDNYSGLESHGIAFYVIKSANSWDETPSVSSWVTGEYDPAANPIKGAAHFGTAHIVITDEAGKVFYDSLDKIDRLSEAGAGKYVLSATVADDANFSALPLYTFNFSVYAKRGMPAWGVVLIVLGVVLIIAAVILLMLKLGVFGILTKRKEIEISTRASVDATIASIRAIRMEEEARISISRAKARERARERRAAARGLPKAEKVAALEAKAIAAAERAEKMRLRAEAMQARAEKMRIEASQSDVEELPPPTETAEAPVTETPVTETPVTEAPVTETPVTETPTTETPTSEATETPTTETPATETAEAPAETPEAGEPTEAEAPTETGEPTETTETSDNTDTTNNTPSEE